MGKEEISFLEKLIYSEDKSYIIKELANTNNSLLLHYYIANYNWNNGFEIPTAILENEVCDFGTGLLMFYYADGIRMLESPEEVSNSSLEDWKGFLNKLYTMLINNNFKCQSISYEPELTRIQKYKLKKNTSNISDILLEKSPGETVDIPKI